MIVAIAITISTNVKNVFIFKEKKNNNKENKEK